MPGLTKPTVPDGAGVRFRLGFVDMLVAPIAADQAPPLARPFFTASGTTRGACVSVADATAAGRLGDRLRMYANYRCNLRCPYERVRWPS